MARQAPQDERLFVRDGWRHFRRSYSVTEARWGLGVLVVLLAIAGWLRWRGVNPDPSIYAAPALAGAGAPAPTVTADRGPIPSGLASDSWTEGTITQFTADNLYVKINGRADYFLSFGFERLYFVPLASGSGESAATIDVEIYDLGSAANALGAFAGENKAGDASRAGPGGMTYRARNALFMARGKFYVRAIGSEESDEITAGLAHVETILDEALAGESLPWAYSLFVDGLGLDASAVSYHRENAFSFGFARDVYSAALDEDTEVFIVVRADGSAADALAAEFVAGFESYGERLPGDPPWVKDQYIATMATAVAESRWVLGVRGAPDIATASAALAKLREGLTKLPEELRARAVPATEDREPTTETREPTTEGREPTTETREPTTEGREPTTEDREPTTEDREPTTEDREPTTETREPTTEDREPTTETREPRTEDREPTTEGGPVER